MSMQLEPKPQGWHDREDDAQVTPLAISLFLDDRIADKVLRAYEAFEIVEEIFKIRMHSGAARKGFLMLEHVDKARGIFYARLLSEDRLTLCVYVHINRIDPHKVSYYVSRLEDLQIAPSFEKVDTIKVDVVNGRWLR